VSVVNGARGEATVPGRVASTLLRHVSSIGVRNRSPDLGSLTIRERQVLKLIAEGLSNKEIAARLGIEFATAKNHVHNLLEKLEVNRRSDAVARASAVETEDAARPLDLAQARSGPRSSVSSQR